MNNDANYYYCITTKLIVLEICFLENMSSSNIDLFNQDNKLGDTVIIYLNTGKSVTGIVTEIGDSYIRLKKEDGKPMLIFEKLIGGWETIEASDQSHSMESNKIEDQELEKKDGEEEKLPESDESLNKSNNKNHPNSPASSLTDEYKPGDVIPLDILEKIDPTFGKSRIKRGSNLEQAKMKPKKIGNDFDSLSYLVDKAHEEENAKIVPANGEVRYINDERNFGFIYDAESAKQIYFSLNEILDKENNSLYHKMPAVVYSVVESIRGPKAIAVHLPMIISEMLKLANSLIDQKQYKQASYLMNQILKEYPDNFSADRLLEKLNAKIPFFQMSRTTVYYSKAKEFHKSKDYPKAIEYYKMAIEKGEKTDSSIKDLGMLYAYLYKQYLQEDSTLSEKYRNEAKELMKLHSKDLPKNLSTLYYLENLYYSLKEYKEFIKITDKLIGTKEVENNKLKYCSLLYKKSIALIQLEASKEEVLNTVEEALSYDPQNQYILKLKTALENNTTDDLKAIVSASEFDNLDNGISKFIQDTLDNYEDYYGVPPQVVQSKDFKDSTLANIRSIIDKAGRARPRERARYLLTEGKLLTILEPDSPSKLRSVMQRYCNAMALVNISEHGQGDVTRFYYNEAFSLDEEYSNNSRQVALYILTNCLNPNELLEAQSKGVAVDDAIEQFSNKEFSKRGWETILQMFVSNNEISAKLISLFYKVKKYKDLAIKALNQFGINDLDDNLSSTDFVQAWNRARESSSTNYKRAVAKIKAFGESKKLEDIVSHLQSFAEIKEDWMTTLDARRIDSISENIYPALLSYINSSGYRNKELNYNTANGQLNQLIDETVSGPTKLSYEAILPLLRDIASLLELSFNDIIKMSVPKIAIKLLSSETLVNENNIVAIQLLVTSHKDSSPIRQVSIDIENTDQITTIDHGETLSNAIEGGDSHIFKLKIKVGNDIIKQKATSLNVVCHYTSGEEIKKEISAQSLRLYSPTEYKPIENPYAPIADGGPVPIDSKMFYGRDEFINNIVNSIVKSPSKQIIIYGQKRCGKSSVLNHLKKRLQDTNKMFCVSFSMGDIIQNLNEVSFYYKILSSIQDELEFGDYDQCPNWTLPSKDDFQEEDAENPVNTFTRYIMRFKKECKNTHGWEDKNLVVMIDEFTYLYTEIKKGNISSSIMKQWKAITQNDRAQFSVVLVGQDVVPRFKQEDYARNAFGVIQDIRLTYLQDEPARALIVDPIRDENGNSRYIDNAVSKIIEYTSRNPYYIQIFCSKLVDYMNSNKLISVTEADVIDVAKTLIVGSESLGEDKFDNLVRAGEVADLQEYSDDEILKVLRQISLNSKNLGFCKRSDIHALEDKNREDAILEDLTAREVLEIRGEDNYKIQVRLFQEWLLNH